MNETWSVEKAELEKKIKESETNSRGNSSKGKESGNTQVNHINRVKEWVIKSPSDTTIYAPGLMRQGEADEQYRNTDMLNQISSFVENIRIQDEQRRRTSPVRPVSYDRVVRDEEPGTSDQQQVVQKQQAGPSLPKEETESEYVRRLAEEKIVRAEKFKANFEKPKGGCCVDDDEFSHVTCHLNVNLKDKIARGEFVDLERLLPKSVKMVQASE